VRGDANDDLGISEAVAAAVKEGYDVIAENIREGRLAAKRFRDGSYNIREVPGDIEEMSLRVVGLARELALTSFDVCERLVKLVGMAAPAGDRGSRGAPGFRPTVAKAATAAARPPDDMLKLTVRFSGGAEARSHTHALTRPKQPTAVREISASPLVLRGAEQAQIAEVTFKTDMAVEGLIAVVALPDGQTPGVYSGLVHAEREPVPLGVLTIEIHE
jgi:hypothetical protein